MPLTFDGPIIRWSDGQMARWLRHQRSLYRFYPRRRHEAKLAIAQGHVFLPIRKPEFRRRSVGFHQHDPDDLIRGVNLQLYLADLARHRLRHAAQHRVVWIQRSLIYSLRKSP